MMRTLAPVVAIEPQLEIPAKPILDRLGKIAGHQDENAAAFA